MCSHLLNSIFSEGGCPRLSDHKGANVLHKFLCQKKVFPKKIQCTGCLLERLVSKCSYFSCPEEVFHKIICAQRCYLTPGDLKTHYAHQCMYTRLKQAGAEDTRCKMFSCQYCKARRVHFEFGGHFLKSCVWVPSVFCCFFLVSHCKRWPLGVGGGLL